MYTTKFNIKSPNFLEPYTVKHVKYASEYTSGHK